jgi:hypothetical protein
MEAVPLSNQPVPLPDYRGGSIVNLMSSVAQAMGGEPCPFYPPLLLLPPARLEGARNLVLFVVDGLGYRHLTGALPGGALRQHLLGPITSVFPTTTATAITTFLTGVAPQQHALTGWFMYFRELGTVMAVLPFRARHGGESLGKGGVDPARIFGHASLFSRLPCDSYVVVPEHIADSDFNAAHCAGAERRRYTTLRQFFKQVRQVLRENDRRKYIYAYWPELDSLAHTHGVKSQEVASHLGQLDTGFAGLLQDIRGTETALVLTADHGVIDCDPQRLIHLEEHPKLSDTLLLPLCGERRLAYCYLSPRREAEFEAYVREHLQDAVHLFPSEDLASAGYFGLGPPDSRLLARIGHYALLMRENCTIKDWILGERRHTHIGSHGGLSDAELYVPLVYTEL